jgi:ATP-binding cassette subfamily B protein
MPDSQIHNSPHRFAVLAKYLKGYKGYLIFGAVAVLFANGLLLINPYVLKLIFDALEKNDPQETILGYVAIVLTLSITAGIFRFFMRRTIIWMSRKLEYDLRDELFAHLLTLSPAFYDRNRTGDIMARMTNDLEAVRMMIGPGIMQIANSIVTIAVALSFMIFLSPKLTLYALMPAVLLPFLVNKLGNMVHKKYSKIQEHFSVLTAAAQENLAGIRVVKAYRQEEEEIAHFGKVSQQYVKLNMEMAKLYGIMFPLLIFVASLLNLAVLYFGGLDVIEGRIPLGTIVAFFAYLTMLFWPIMAGGWVVSLYQRGTASLDRINAVLNTPSIVKNDHAGMHVAPMRGEIEFRNLIFAYDGLPILNGISLHIKPGQTVGIVGSVGSGKTTLVSLLPRLYPVTRGMLFIDGVDLNDWDLASLRKQIGFATQEPFLFSDSLRDNLRFGEADAAEERVREVAEVSALTKDIEQFPEGYDTVVGERGITLSGGQKQRTAIGRALLPDPAVVVLDDATSAVDTETEDQINVRMHAALKHRTTFIISHRVSSVKEADLIIYLVDGKIAERGNHHELIAHNGYYADLYRAQLLAEEIEKL